MGRLIHLRRGRSPLHAVEETIAALHEELEFSTNFAYAMVREENYRAAAEVIDEQRRSLVRASDRITTALRKPEIERARLRARAALAGLAAVLALGSGAFAAFGPRPTPPADQKIQAIQEATDALEAAVAISDPITLSAIVAPAQEQIMAAAAGVAVGDPGVQATLLASVQKLHKIIGNPALPEKVRRRAQQVADTVQQIMVDPDVPDITPPDGAPNAPDSPAEASDTSADATP